MEEPKISILTACHNSALYLHTCIKSVMRQNYTNWEWVIADDHSDDGSAKILQRIRDQRVKILISPRRLFCSSAYALALQHATGDYCGILDSDDALAEGAMQTIIKQYLKHSQVDFIYTQHYWCDENLKPLRKGISSLPKDTFVNMSLQKHHCYSHWRTFKRSLPSIQRIFPDGLQWSVDKHMGFVLEELGQGGFYPKALYYYRYHRKNMSRTNAKDQKFTTNSLALAFQQSREMLDTKVRNIIKVK